MMASLPLINRDNLFYNKFEYRARFKIVGAYLLYHKTKNLSRKHISPHIDKNEVNTVIQNLPLLNIINTWIIDHKTSHELCSRIERNTLSVYSNDLPILEELNNIIPSVIEKVVYSKQVGVKTFVKEPKHKFRVYFKSKRVNPEIRENIRQILEKNKKIYPSNSLLRWLSNECRHWQKKYLSSCYCIDYDDESIISYLSLMLNDILGHCYKLEKRQDTT
jgi:hypothetical protein